MEYFHADENISSVTSNKHQIQYPNILRGFWLIICERFPSNEAVENELKVNFELNS